MKKLIKRAGPSVTEHCRKLSHSRTEEKSQITFNHSDPGNTKGFSKEATENALNSHQRDSHADQCQSQYACHDLSV